MAEQQNDLITWTHLPPRAHNRNNRNTDGVLATEQGNRLIAVKQGVQFPLNDNYLIIIYFTGDQFPKKFSRVTDPRNRENKRGIDGKTFDTHLHLTGDRFLKNSRGCPIPKTEKTKRV